MLDQTLRADGTRLRRILLVTAGLMVTGAIAGAITAMVAVTIVMLVVSGLSALADLGWGMAVAAMLGAPIGAVILPLEAWVLLRRVPLWRALAETAAGTILGAVAFALLSPGPILGAVIGFTLAAIRLRIATRGGQALGARGRDPLGP
jgi:hypothetical protein